MSCPRCRTPLDSHQAPRLVLHGCPSCGGIWLDADASQRVVESIDPNVIAAADEESRSARVRPDVDAAAPCPLCQRAMEKMPIQEARVVVDACRQHGVWFDRDELQTVLRSLPQRQTPVPMAPSSSSASSPQQAQTPQIQPQMQPPMPQPQAAQPGYVDNPAARFFAQTNEPAQPPMGFTNNAPPVAPQSAPNAPGGMISNPAAAFFTDNLGGQPAMPQGAMQPGQPGRSGIGGQWSPAVKTALAVGGGVAAVAGVAYVATHMSPQHPGGLSNIGNVLSKLF